MSIQRYRVINRITGHWSEAIAASAQEACGSLGWLIGDCFILELPLPHGPGSISLTDGEKDQLKDAATHWGHDLTNEEAQEVIRILQKWVDHQANPQLLTYHLASLS